MLSVRNLEKQFVAHGADRSVRRTVQAVRNVSLTIEPGEFFTLLGPSGCGKTTTLQCIAGLETPDAGEIEVGGKVVFSSDRRILVPSNRRDLGMVFQSYAIWPHMTVYENVAFPLQQGHRSLSRRAIDDRVMAALSRVQLETMANRPAPYLSGGQQQRVALARALVHEPKLVLLDEPLSNLDAKLRETMRTELRHLLKSLGITAVYVTHDQVEALSMSDRIALMYDGTVVQQGPPKEMYQRPANVFAAEFMGRSNLIPARIAAAVESGAIGHASTDFGEIAARFPEAFAAGEDALLMVRPHAIEVRPIGSPHEAPTVATNTFEGIVEDLSFVGETLDALIRVGSHRLRVALNAYLRIEPGQAVSLSVTAEHCVIMRPDRRSAEIEDAREPPRAVASARPLTIAIEGRS